MKQYRIEEFKSAHNESPAPAANAFVEQMARLGWTVQAIHYGYAVSAAGLSYARILVVMERDRPTEA